MAVHTRYRITSPKLADVISLMERTGAETSGIAEIAGRVALSTRQVERLFQRHLATSPSEFYLGLRLARARTLLRETSQSVRAIAVECGFKSTSHFSSAYRRSFGRRPTDERQPAASAPRKKTSGSGKHAPSRKNKIG
jgi:transcriptional regulator GlxA family with amidase domain